MSILIIGAGISGLACAQLLLDKKIKSIILERERNSGGLIHCEMPDGFLYHRVGGHVFNSKNKEVLDWFWGKFRRDEEFLKVERNAQIYLKERFIKYPIETSLHQLEKPVVEKIIDELLASKSTDPDNFHDFLLQKFGETLCSMYFFPYNEKIWQCSLKDVSIDWLDGKLPTPSTSSILIDNILRQKEAEMVHSTFYYPVTGGSQFIADRLAESLSIETNCPVEKITVSDEGLIVNGRPFDKVVYTGDIRKLQAIVDSDDEALNNSLRSLCDLKSHGTTNILCECDPTDISWLYLPEANTKAHRIIYTGNFSPSNNGKSTRSSCVVEFSGFVPRDVMTEEIKSLPGNLRPIDHNYQESSYVIHDSMTHHKVDAAIKELNRVNIFPLGRFAEWQYYNMDAAIESAMRLVSRLSD